VFLPLVFDFVFPLFFFYDGHNNLRNTSRKITTVVVVQNTERTKRSLQNACTSYLFSSVTHIDSVCTMLFVPARKTVVLGGAAIIVFFFYLILFVHFFVKFFFFFTRSYRAARGMFAGRLSCVYIHLQSH